MSIKRKRSWKFKPIHAAFVLTAVCHILVLFAYGIYGSQTPKKEKMRVIAQVDVVDTIKMPVQPTIAPKKLGIAPPKVVSKSAPLPTNGPPSQNPGRVGKPGRPGNPGKPGGGSGRAGLRTAIDPDVPDLGGDLFGTSGYPVGHGYGVGNKHGTGSGFGQGNGVGDGIGDGDGGDGGEGGEGSGGDGGGEGILLDPYHIDWNTRDEDIDPHDHTVPAGYISLNFRNASSQTRSLMVEGLGTAAIYGTGWLNVPPGGAARCNFMIDPGYYTVSVYDGPDTSGP
ncbi:hypothetical protein IJT17_07740, partial [bacterium]|nr:hypothetical protein [bacterium]